MGEFLGNEKRDPLPCEKRLDGKTVLISGATSGIGLETARRFAEMGARLICLNRDAEKSSRLEAELRQRFGCDIRTIPTDFAQLDNVRETAARLLELKNPLDILIHNAGVFNTKKLFTTDNIEMVFQVNHLGSFLLNYLLKERLKNDNRARIIYVNSEGHRFALAGVHLNDLEWKLHIYTGLKSYGAAKTAQLLTMQRFSDYFADSAVTINAMHPGIIEITATVKTSGQTGIEMEALTAVTVAALTIYDMCKAVDRGMEITDIRLLKKSGGRSGDWERDNAKGV